MATNHKSEAELSVGDSLEFHYQKSPDYRTIHCYGAHGGITPRGYIHFTLYNERGTIPRRSSRVAEKVEGAGSYLLGKEKVEESLSGVMRQLEVTVFMDINASREFYSWLGNKIWRLEETIGISESEREGTPLKDQDQQT